MTCIIGIKCVDGVVLAGDKRILRGTEFSDEPKIITPFINYLVGASGLSGIMDKFLYEMNLFLRAPREEGLDWRMFLFGIEDIALNLYRRYENRLDIAGSAEIGAYYFDVLMAYKPYENSAVLSHMYGTGFSTEVKTFDVIGHGRPSALPFIKSLYNENRSMYEMSKVVAFTLMLIDEAKIDLSVGGFPQIFNLPDIGDARELTEVEILDMIKRSPIKILEDILIN